MKKYICITVVIVFFSINLGLLSFMCPSTLKLKHNIILGNNMQEVVIDNIILLIDNSGSMLDTDPDKLAVVAASMLIDTLNPEDNANIIAFGDKVQSPYRLKDKPSAQTLKYTMTMLNYKDNNTNLKDGLNEALNQLDEVEGLKKIIVLSDGKEDPKGGLTKEHENEFSALIDRAYNSKIEIHTIGLSSLADKDMLNKISYKTGGTSFSCSNPGELFDIFGNIVGGAKGYYTVDKYTTNSLGEKNINFSNYIEDVIIKTASIDNKMPNIEVSQNGQNLSADKYTERYKIFRIKGGNNSSIKIKSLDVGKNIVIIQMKSKVGLKTNIVGEGFQIPYKIPIDVICNLELETEIQGMHMDAIISGRRESLIKQENNFKFRFQGEKPGQYTVFITAYDGNNNIVTVRSLNINVTDSPPFYYTSEPPQQFIFIKPLTISLKQMDKTKIEGVSGEIIADYGDQKDTFPLVYRDGIVSADISFRKTGKIKLSTCINGIYNNQSFSYYLPQLNISVIDRPFADIAAVKPGGVFKKGEVSKLELKIENSLVYQEENISVFDSSGKNIGSFVIKERQKGEISFNIKPTEPSDNLILYFKGSEELKLTEKLETNIKVVAGIQYFLLKNRFGIITAAIIAAAAGIVIIIGWYTFKTKVLEYRVAKDLYYRINGKIRTLNIELSIKNSHVIFINLGSDNIYESTKEDNAIGYFELQWPKKMNIIIGILYILKGKSIFEVRYNAIIVQTLLIDDMEENTPVSYRDDVLIKFKNRNINYEIQFQ